MKTKILTIAVTSVITAGTMLLVQDARTTYENHVVTVEKTTGKPLSWGPGTNNLMSQVDLNAKTCTKPSGLSSSEEAQAKQDLMRQHGYEVDSEWHLDYYIPLSLGGSTDTSNLWLEPVWETPSKKKLEEKFYNEVCSGEMTLYQAQDNMRKNYHIYYK